MIAKSSDYWPEAVEEKAWAYFRKNDFDRVQSDMKTLMSPIFADQVGPEPFFLDGFAKLKVCDYPGIFDDIRAFKAAFKDRLALMEELAKTGGDARTAQAVAALSGGVTEFKNVASFARRMPRMFHRDGQLASLAAKKAPLKDIQARVKTLAATELEEGRKIINKFHILEAEAIQRMHLQDKKSDRDIVTQEIAGDELQFPVKDDEIWADELDKFQVNSRGCPDLKIGDKSSGKKQEKAL
jgi:hypothetical protein